MSFYFLQFPNSPWIEFGVHSVQSLPSWNSLITDNNMSSLFCSGTFISDESGMSACGCREACTTIEYTAHVSSFHFPSHAFILLEDIEPGEIYLIYAPSCLWDLIEWKNDWVVTNLTFSSVFQWIPSHPWNFVLSCNSPTTSIFPLYHLQSMSKQLEPYMNQTFREN